jgi:O-antigen/teichoic acid export membrane protein
MRRRLPDLLILGLLLLLPLILFWQQTVGGLTLLPTENLYQFEPHATYREVVQAPAVPQNHLLSDLVLQNYQWKSLLRDSIARRELPLWNPHQFAGIPFLAAGQQSALYPPSLLYYVLPLPAAYGWFTVVNLWLAGMFAYTLLRGLGAARIGGAVSGVTYQLCGFFIASAVHPMIIGAVVWLPLLLLMAEFVIRRRPLFGRATTIPWAAVGAGTLACNILAGHVEITIYTLLITAYYAGARLLWLLWRSRGDHLRAAWRRAATSSAWLLVMVGLGVGLAAAQFIPLYEFASVNWRTERADLRTVLSYAHPPRDVIQFALPNFYGSPAHQSYFDVFELRTVTEFANLHGEPIHFIDWGIKNYVEAALYLGILPLALAAFALIDAWRRRGSTHGPPYRLMFVLLTLAALTFMFGLPTYAALFALPGINQLNTPFRWVFGVTVGVAILAGFGADALWRARRDGDANTLRWARRAGYGLLGGGGLILAGLLLSRAFYPQIEPLLLRVVENAALADRAFSGPRMFYSYQFTNVLTLGLVTLGSGLIFLLAGGYLRRALWQIGAVGLIAVDLMIASWGFNPASDPLLLDFTPPSIEWLLERQEQEGPFRYTTIDDPAGHYPLLQPNVTMRYGLDDIRGYDSIIPAQYVAYMRATSMQNQLDHNRVAPVYYDRLAEVDWGRLNLLNVRYVVTHRSITLPEEWTLATDEQRFPPRFQPVYEDEAVRIWRNSGALPRVFLTTPEDDDIDMQDLDGVPFTSFDVTLRSDTGREKLIAVDLTGAATHWLVVSETHMPGWRAFVRPQLGALFTELDERPLEVQRVLENFQGVRLDPAELAAVFERELNETDDPALATALQTAIDNGRYTLRLVYSPTTFQVGAFGSVISGALLVFLLGVWLWRLFIVPTVDEDTDVSRVARNSVAPIILNLFNRGIDFAFAIVMLRILGPEDAGFYYYAIVVFIWFDIFTNFGLDVYLIRAVSRNRERAAHHLLNTGAMRLFLMLACVPLLLGFLLVRQSAIEPPLTREALLAIGLLYIGLAPGSLNKGLTSLFYAFERAEYPAAVTTITTINKAVLGLLALLLGYGIVGLAAVSIVVNVFTLGILLWAGRGLIGRLASRRLDRSLIRKMTGESWPLMLNHFLATVFFQIDIIILEAIQGARIVGQYSVAYRWLLALNIIPAFFTQALLPVMSRQAEDSRDQLKRTYTLGVKLLVALAIPLAVVFTFLAEALTWLLAGVEFLPGGAIALQIMIWSIPIGWINSLTQYALIAVDMQRRITVAFFMAVTFNIVTNLIFIPIYGYRAAAVTTILSEMVLLVPFGVLMHQALGRLDWLGMIWKPLAAGTAMLALMLLLWPARPGLAVAAGLTLYPLLLAALRPLSGAELALLNPLLPERLKKQTAT